jgi:hypothetical protein
MLLFIAVVYILLWCFLYSKKYMAWEVPSGYVRPTLMGPSCGGGDNDCPRCSSGHNKGTYVPTCVGPDLRDGVQNLSYCEPSDSDSSKVDQLPCEYRDEYFSQYPRIERDSAFMTTAFAMQEESLPTGCDSGTRKDPACLNWGLSKKSFNYIAQAENFTLGIDHSMVTSLRREGKGPTQLQSRTGCGFGKRGQISAGTHSFVAGGEIQDEDGLVYDPCDDYKWWGKGKACPAYINVFGVGGAPTNGVTPQDQPFDLVPLQTFLRAANVSLDDNSPDAEPGKGSTYRYTGAVIFVTVFYTNVDTSLSPHSFQYNRFKCAQPPRHSSWLRALVLNTRAVQVHVQGKQGDLILQRRRGAGRSWRLE